MHDYDFKQSKKEFNKFRLEYPTQMSNETLAEISLALDIADQIVQDASDEMIKAGWSAYGQFAKPENKTANAWRRMRDELKTCEREPIGLPYDGETFSDPDLQSFKERLLMLRAAGYHFPDYVLETIDEEIAEAPHDAGQ